MGTTRKADNYRQEFQRIINNIEDENLKSKVKSISKELCDYAEQLESENEYYNKGKELPKEFSNLNKDLFDSYDLDALDNEEAVNLIEDLELYIEKLYEG